MASVLLIDEDRLVAEAIAGFLRDKLEGTPVEVAFDAARARTLCGQVFPEIIFTELEFANCDAINLISFLTQTNPACRIAALTTHDYDCHIDRALRAGVSGIVLKSETLETLLACIDALRKGQSFFSESILRHLHAIDGRWQLARPKSDRLAQLSRRERQLLSFLGRGASLKEAAAAMKVSYKTVDNQKASLMRKLDVHDRVELALLAIREKYTSPIPARSHSTVCISPGPASPNEPSSWKDDPFALQPPRQSIDI